MWRVKPHRRTKAAHGDSREAGKQNSTAEKMAALYGGTARRRRRRRIKSTQENSTLVDFLYYYYYSSAVFYISCAREAKAYSHTRGCVWVRFDGNEMDGQRKMPMSEQFQYKDLNETMCVCFTSHICRDILAKVSPFRLDADVFRDFQNGSLLPLFGV